MNLQELREIEHQSSRAYRQAESELDGRIRDAIRDAEKRIRLFFEPDYARVRELSMTAWHAKRAREVAEVEFASSKTLTFTNKLTVRAGDRIWTYERPNDRWNKKIIQAVVEIATHDTVWPDNIRYHKPEVGELFLRRCDKDGKPGKALVSTNWRHDWKSIETLAS